MRTCQIPRAATALLLSALPLLFFVACGQAPDAEGAGEAEVHQEAPLPNLLLITLDTTRVDRLGAYGYEAAQTPHLDSLARDGARFTRAYAHVPLTLPSHASLFTGTFPPEHGIHDNGRNSLGPELTTLAEVFRIHGYRTGAFIAALALDGSFGLDRGFDVYGDDLGQPTEGAPRLLQRRANFVVDEALAWLNAGDEPFFAWVHFYDPHARYEAPADFAMDDPYDAELSFMDAQVGRLLGWLNSRQLAQNTLIIAIADHGESLGEHGEATHGSFIYQGTQHIPLLVRGPGVARAGLVCDALVQQADLLPTLLELYGWPRLGQASGSSFAASLRGEPIPENTIYLESDYCALNFGWSTLRGIVHDKWKFIQAPTRELYDLERDPGETDNLAAEHPELVASLEQKLVERRSGMRVQEAVEASPTSELVAALAGLGYAQGFGTGAPDEAATGLNPIEHIDALELYHEAVGFGHVGEAERMIAPLEEVVRMAPESAGFRAVLGESYLRVGRLDDAIRVLEEALKLDPSYDPAFYHLANAYAQKGELDKAIPLLEAALSFAPTHTRARRELAQLMLQRGDVEAALAQFERASEDDPGSALGWLQVANLRVGLGRWPAAVEALERATALTPNDWGLVNFHAWVLACAPDAAARDGARAVSLAEAMIAAIGEQDPGSLDTLAAAYAEVGRFEQAISSAQRALELARGAQQAELATQISARLEQYRAHRPFRDE